MTSSLKEAITHPVMQGIYIVVGLWVVIVATAATIVKLVWRSIGCPG